MADYHLTIKRHDIVDFEFLGFEVQRSHYYLEIRSAVGYEPHPSGAGAPIFPDLPTMTIHGLSYDPVNGTIQAFGNDSDSLIATVRPGRDDFLVPDPQNPGVLRPSFTTVAERTISYETGTPKDIRFDVFGVTKGPLDAFMPDADLIYQHIQEAQTAINEGNLKYSNHLFRESQNSNTVFRAILDALGLDEGFLGIDFSNANNPGAERRILDSNRELNPDEAIQADKAEDYFTQNGQRCFVAGTEIMMSDGSRKPIQDVVIDDSVLAYDSSRSNGQGSLLSGRVIRTYATPDKLVIDFHGLKVTPGHVFLCGDGEYVGQHRMLMEILRADGTIVKADGTVLRAATNAPAGSRQDAFVKVAYLTDANDALMQNGRMRAGTLVLTADGETKSVLECLEAEGYSFDSESGLVAKEGEEPHPLYWYGEIPRPEDYVLKRSDLTDADLYGEPDYQPEVAAASSRLGLGFTPAEGTRYASAPKRAGETIH